MLYLSLYFFCLKLVAGLFTQIFLSNTNNSNHILRLTTILNKKKYKSELLDLLENNEDVKRAIKKVVASGIDYENTNKVHELKKELEESQQIVRKLEKELEESQQMIEKLKEILGIKNNDNKKLESKVEELKISLQKTKDENIALTEQINKNSAQIEHYESLFKDEIAAYQWFDTLSSHTKKALSGIFKDDSIKGFIACGIQERNINNLWEYIKNEVIEDKNKDISNLKLIFEFLFSRYVLAYPMYELQQVDIGDVFDPQQHIKHSSSKNVSGDIQDILLSGWINKKTDKLVKQSVVII